MLYRLFSIYARLFIKCVKHISIPENFKLLMSTNLLYMHNVFKSRFLIISLSTRHTSSLNHCPCFPSWSRSNISILSINFQIFFTKTFPYPLFNKFSFKLFLCFLFSIRSSLCASALSSLFVSNRI